MTGDDVERVDENRRRLCAEIGADPDRLALNRQVHSTLVHRAEPGARGEPGDGLWTDEPGRAGARDDRRLPADRAGAHGRRAGGRRPARRLARAARRDRRAGAETLGGRLQAAVGPAIGPCCYEVGDEVAEPFAAAFGADVVRGGKLDLWSAAERALTRRASMRSRADLCTAATPTGSSRTAAPGKPRGVQGVIARVA